MQRHLATGLLIFALGLACSEESPKRGDTGRNSGDQTTPPGQQGFGQGFGNGAGTQGTGYGQNPQGWSFNGGRLSPLSGGDNLTYS